MSQFEEIFDEFFKFVKDPLVTFQAVEDQIEYGNDWERVVIGKKIPVRASEAIRYQWAEDTILELNLNCNERIKVLDVGCGSGYGSRFFETGKFHYTGIDLDSKIIEYASRNYGSEFTEFHVASLEAAVLTLSFDVLIAFEIIEHLEHGKKIADALSKLPQVALISVPYKEPVGYWGPHHRLHNLSEADFPNYDPIYLDMKTGKLQEERPIIDLDEYYPFLMLLRSKV